MTNQLEALEYWAAGLLKQLEPESRNRLAQNLGRALRKSQQQRISTQRNRDGSKYAPRKRRNLRDLQGRVRRKVHMFRRLRTVRFLKTQSNGNTLSIGFTGRNARIAKVHQYGLNGRAERGAPDVKYEQREVLGFKKADLDLIRNGLQGHLFEP
ncbi:phage virion morphogenesis protein [Pseudomonas sp. PS02303]|uniref:phage virion morphogenesis protein n=1 Tax=Pseudomonas sp. PS02303 TaxID=2991429 RepID=UPI00249A21EC|nr:phage virion morphogenesis protein [Pseudomonas sp. PS02303]